MEQTVKYFPVIKAVNSRSAVKLMERPVAARRSTVGVCLRVHCTCGLCLSSPLSVAILHWGVI